MWPRPTSRFDPALPECVVARFVEAGLGEIAEAEQRSRGVAGADQHAVAREGGDRLLDALDQKLQPLEQRHGAADGFGGGDQDAVVAIGKFKPGTAAGDEHAQRRAEAAQPLQPDRAAQRQSSRKAEPPGAGARPPDRRVFGRGPRHWPRRTVWRRPDWPRESGCRRATIARRGRRLSHGPPVADRRRLATGIPHYSSQRHDPTGEARARWWLQIPAAKG